MKPKTVNQLCIFSRYPEAGACKTRLIPALGARGAARLQQYMTEHMLHIAQQLSYDFLLCLAGGSCDGCDGVQAWLGSGISYAYQQGEDLGQRMAGQFHASFAAGYACVVLIGADCPGIDQPLLDEAFRSLESSDMVLGPTVDGGYYLIGMKNMHAPLFSDIGWGSGQVAEQTLAIAEGLGLSVMTLAVLHDVDCLDDLEHLPEQWLRDDGA